MIGVRKRMPGERSSSQEYKKDKRWPHLSTKFKATQLQTIKTTSFHGKIRNRTAGPTNTSTFHLLRNDSILLSRYEYHFILTIFENFKKVKSYSSNTN